MTYHLFITCPRGLESVLIEELQQQDCQQIEATDGGVACVGALEQIYRVNLYSRVASRVLLRVAQARYRSEEDIFQAAKKVAWTDWFNVSQTFKVKVESKRAAVKSLNFVALKIKDAVCDVFYEKFNERPSVDKLRPDVRLHAFLDSKKISLFIDTSGEALFKRGYRLQTGAAPLRENVAAGLLLLAGYDGSQPLQDPFCGSGTIAIEAAWIATKRATGLMRHFGFELLKNFDKALWIKLKAAARKNIQNQVSGSIGASDNDAEMIRLAKQNAQMAEVSEWIDFSVADAQDVRPNGKQGLILSNPPYGVRLAEIQTLHALYPQLGSWLKQYYAGWSAAMFTGDKEMPKLMRLKPKRKIPLYNGKLDCRLFLFDMVSGSNR
ncbi:MAG: class I SAM-dependent RNA methyltransferase [Neisseriaceae bacterium]|nr:class I SAM-dependent RNA methyltransferase [Neisseriaceae bacterium]